MFDDYDDDDLPFDGGGNESLLGYDDDDVNPYGDVFAGIGGDLAGLISRELGRFGEAEEDDLPFDGGGNASLLGEFGSSIGINAGLGPSPSGGEGSYTHGYASDEHLFASIWNGERGDESFQDFDRLKNVLAGNGFRTTWGALAHLDEDDE